MLNLGIENEQRKEIDQFQLPPRIYCWTQALQSNTSIILRAITSLQKGRKYELKTTFGCRKIASNLRSTLGKQFGPNNNRLGKKAIHYQHTAGADTLEVVYPVEPN